MNEQKIVIAKKDNGKILVMWVREGRKPEYVVANDIYNSEVGQAIDGWHNGNYFWSIAPAVMRFQEA